MWRTCSVLDRTLSVRSFYTQASVTCSRRRVCPSRQLSGHPCQRPLEPHTSISRPLSKLSAGKNQSAVSSSLVSVLKDELKYERESYRREEVLLEGPPCEFGMLDRPGRNTFFLGKEHKGELIQVKVDLENQPMSEQVEDMGEGEDDDEDEGTLQDTNAIHFTVTVLKPEQGLQLVFDCESNGEYMSIIHLAFEDVIETAAAEAAAAAAASGPQQRSVRSMLFSMGDDGDREEEELMDLEDKKDPRYTGPVFDELDDTLQQAFIDYLEERGVTAELGEFLRLYALDKMAVEYQGWLGKVRDFVSSA